MDKRTGNAAPDKAVSVPADTGADPETPVLPGDPALSAETNGKELRKTANRVFRGLFFYELIILVLSPVANAFGLDEGAAMMLSCGVGVLLLLLIDRRSFRVSALFAQRERKMDAPTLLLLFGAVMLCQLLALLFISLTEALGLNPTDIGSADTGETAMMFLYASLLGPFFEELVFRGFLLEPFRKYGTVFAVLVSALFFGLMHENLGQFFAAGFAGLLLGYTACTFGFRWAVVLHVFNNFVLTYLLSLIEESAGMSEDAAFIAELVLFLLVSAVTVAVAVRKRRGQIAAFFRGPNARYAPGSAGQLLRSGWMWACLLLMGGLTVIVTLFA